MGPYSEERKAGGRLKALTPADSVFACVLQPTSASSWLLWAWQLVPIVCGATGPTRPSCPWGYFWLLPTPWRSRWEWRALTLRDSARTAVREETQTHFLCSGHPPHPLQAQALAACVQFLSSCGFRYYKIFPEGFKPQGMLNYRGGREIPSSRVRALNMTLKPSTSVWL